MMNKTLMWTAMFNIVLRPAALIVVLDEVWVWVVINISLVEVLCIDVRDDSVLADVVVGVSVDVLTDVDGILLDKTELDFEFDLSVSYAVDVLAGVWAKEWVNIDGLIDMRIEVFIGALTVFVWAIVVISSGLGAVVLVEADENSLTAVMTALEFTVSTSL